MKNKQSKIAKIFLIFLTLFCLSANSFAAASRNLTIFAEPNMALPLTKIARLFSQNNNTIVSLNFNPTSDLVKDIDSGEPADILVSAHLELLESLRQKGVVDVHNFAYVASDNLVLLTAADNDGIFSALQKKPEEQQLSFEQALKILDKNRANLIIDNFNNSSGNSSQKLLTQLRLSNLKISKKINEDKTSIFSIIQSEKKCYTLLLKSQTFNHKELQIIAEKKDANIFYEALVIAGDNMEVAREFLKFVKSDLAKTILQESGFATE